MNYETTTRVKPAATRKWMVIYTRSNWEKKSSQLLDLHSIQSYCPLIKIKKKWADRYKMLEMPLFKSYLFVHVTPAEQHKILQIPGIIGFVKHCNVPVSIPETEIHRIQQIIHTNNDTISLVNYQRPLIGDRVTINSGPFAQQHGQVTDVNGSTVLMVLEQLGCALIVKVNQHHVTPAGANNCLVN